MNRIRLLAIGSMLLTAPGMLAQQTAPPAEPAKGAAQGVVLPDVGDQLKVLTQKLDLSVDQQPKVKTILQELNDASLKLMHDESTSHEELLSKVRPLRINADKKIREILSDDQKKKLDQYLQGPHRGNAWQPERGNARRDREAKALKRSTEEHAQRSLPRDGFRLATIRRWRSKCIGK